MQAAPSPPLSRATCAHAMNIEPATLRAYALLLSPDRFHSSRCGLAEWRTLSRCTHSDDPPLSLGEGSSVDNRVRQVARVRRRGDAWRGYRRSRAHVHTPTGQKSAAMVRAARTPPTGRLKNGRMLPSDLMSEVTKACSTMVPMTIPSTIA